MQFRVGKASNIEPRKIILLNEARFANYKSSLALASVRAAQRAWKRAEDPSFIRRHVEKFFDFFFVYFLLVCFCLFIFYYLFFSSWNRP